MNRLKVFKAAYDNAINEIDEFLEPSSCTSMNGLVSWMLQTDANPYSYLDENWARALETAEGFVDLLHCIHHAVYDDGDITFVSVNGLPRLVFADKFDENFREQALSKQEQEFEKGGRWGNLVKYEIEILDIEPNEFGPLYDQAQKSHI